MAFLDYYAILGVPRSATLEQIQRAYRLLSARLHPDVLPKDDWAQAWATEQMKEINEAYSVLKDSQERASYDSTYSERKAADSSSHQEQQRQQRQERRQQHKEPRVPCPLCEQRGRITCLTCEGRGDADCPGCDGRRVVICPLCAGVGTLTEAKYREFNREWERAQQQAKAEAARQEAEAAVQQRAQAARQAAEARRRVVLAGVGVLCLLFVARSCGDSVRPVVHSTVQAPHLVQPTPYRPFVTPAPERTRPRATPSRPPLRSKHDLTPTQVTFRNETRDPINVLWINYEGREVPYRTLDPGDSYTQPTFATHPWRLRDAITGRTLKTMVAGPTPSHVVVGQGPRITPRSTMGPNVTAPLPTIEPPGSQALRRGIELYRARRFSGALAEFQSAAQGGPDRDEAWAWLGMVNVALGQTTEALAAFRHSVELNPRGRQADLAQQWIAKLEASAATPAPPTHRGPTIQVLTELSPIMQLQTAFPGSGTLLGQPYRFAVIHANRSGFMARTAYHLNGQYDRFEVTVGMEGSGKLLQQAAAKVFGDGELLFESPSLGLGQPPVKVSVSVRGVTRLELQSTGLPVVWTIIWADPKLIKD